jgi:hypothetical protein
MDQDEEDGLGRVFGVLWVGEQAEAGAVDQGAMAAH